MANPENETPSIFAWSLNKSLFSNTIFAKKKMVEFTNVKKVYGFIKNNMGVSFQGVKKYDFISVKDKTEQEQIQRFKELYNNDLKCFQTAVILPKHKWGRVVPANDYLSLSIMRRETRHSFCDGIYKDIDMINAQPTAVFEIAKQNDKQMEYLEDYIKKPKEYRELIMTHHNCSKDCAKNLAITLMMGGSYDGWIKEWDIQNNTEPEQRIGELQHIEKELKDIVNLVYASNQHIKKDVLKQDPTRWKTEAEAKRGVMGLWSQSIERLFQEEVIKFLIETKNFEIEKIVPCQDGFMILKELWYDGIIEDCNNIIKSKYNLNILFTEKPFDEKIEIPLYDEGRTYDEWEDFLSGTKMGDKFLEEFGDYVVRYASCIYVYHNNRWWNETDKSSRYKLTIKISKDLYDVVNVMIHNDVSLKERDKSSVLRMLRNKTSSLSNINELTLHILKNVKIIEEDFNTKPFLIGFNNGVYDLEKDEFRDYRFDDYMTMTTKYDFEPVDYGYSDDNEDYLQKDKDGNYEYDITEEQINLWSSNRAIRDELINIFETIQPDAESRTLFLQSLASGLDGRAYQKLLLFNGQGGNGKGLTGSLMDMVLGDYYHQPSNGILKDIEKANSPSPDMYNLKNKRYVNFKEVAGAVKVAMLRNLTGGGKFTGRLLNCNPEQFPMSATFVMEFNVSPDLDGKPQQADYRRLVDILFPVNFTDNPTKINQTIGGVLYKKSNPYYETQEFLKKSKLVFLDMLLGVYRNYKDKENHTGMQFTIPESIRLRTEQFIENQNLFQRVFSNVWGKVDVDYSNKEDIKAKTTPVARMWESITFSEDYKNLTYREKRQYSRDEFYKWIEGLFKLEGNSKTGKLIVGVIRKEEPTKPED
jgi:phage/plasmid-associated DNA primase